MTDNTHAELRTHNEYDSLLTKVLMEQHPEWSMEVVREAALICSNTLIPAVQQEIAKARIKEIETLLDEVMAGDPDDWNRDVEGNLEGYTKYRTAELSKTLKEHKEKL